MAGFDFNDFNDFNTQIMAEFHANSGKVGGRFEGKDVLIMRESDIYAIIG